MIGSAFTRRMLVTYIDDWRSLTLMLRWQNINRRTNREKLLEQYP